MRIKGLMVLVSALALALPTQALAADQVKLGGPCKSKNKTVIYKYSKYKCVLVKGRLIWKLPFVNTPPSEHALTAQANKKILFESLSAIRAYKDLSTDGTFDFESALEPGFYEGTYKSMSESHHWALSQWGSVLKAAIKPKAIYAITPAFIFSSMKNFGASDAWISPNRDFINNAYPSSGKLRRPLWAFSTRINGDPQYPLIVYMAYPGYRPKVNINENGVHEVFHEVQRALNSNPGNLPCWIHEGQASVFGLAYSADGRSESALMAVAKFGGIPGSAGLDLSKIESQTAWEGGRHGSCGGVGEYAQGLVANALLIHRFGVQKNFDFLREMNGRQGDGVTWRDAFLKTFGVTVEDFYAEAANYMRWYFNFYFSTSL